MVRHDHLNAAVPDLFNLMIGDEPARRDLLKKDGTSLFGLLSKDCWFSPGRELDKAPSEESQWHEIG